MNFPSVRIIGLDPGLVSTGWGVISCDGNQQTFIASGCIKSQSRDDLATRLAFLYKGLSGVMENFHPVEASVEKSFVSKDAVASLKLGHARGVVLLIPALFGACVAEYAPNTIKKTIVGVGHADKHQIRRMISFLLPGARVETEHAADALAIAVTHAYHRRRPDKLREVRET